LQTGTIKLKNRLKTGWICPLLTAGCFFLAIAWFSSAWAGTASLSTWFVDMNQYAGAAHGSLKCEECHGSMTYKRTGNGTGKGITQTTSHPDPESANFLKNQTRRTFDYQACQKCHKIAYARFVKGEHAKAATKEKTTGETSKTGFAPGCGDCHSAHYSKSHLDRVKTGKIMTKTCGNCHPDQKKSFLANYHGKAAVNLGHEKAAFCTDCHGAHTMLSLKDKNAALTACLRCHSNAPPEFANIIIHADQKTFDLKNDTKKSGLKWVHGLRVMALILVVAVLAFFFMHTGLLMLRKLHEKLRRHK
jgi:hypothetical protein